MAEDKKAGAWSWAREPGPWLPWAVALVSAVPFLPGLWAKFVMLDDDYNFAKNLNYRGLHLANLKWMFFSFQLGGMYPPLSWVTHAVDFYLWGMNPAGYHLTSILLLSACAAAFYFLALRILALAWAPMTVDQAALRWSAAFAALFFAVHPLRVEVVTWVSNRSYILPCFFYLLTIIAYLKAQQPGARLRWMAVCCVFFALSLFSKAIGMTLPAVLLILDYYPLRRIDLEPLPDPRLLGRLILEKLPLFAEAAAMAYISAKGRVLYGAMVSVSQFGLWARVANALFGVVFYLEKTLLPIRIAPLYSLPTHLHPLDELCLPRTVAALIITALALAWRKRRPWLLPAWAAHVVTLLPVLGLFQYGLLLQIASDKWFLLASIIWSLIAGGIFLHLWETAPQSRRRLAQGAAAILAVLACLTFRQAMTWHDTETLFTHNLAVEPDCYFCHNNLAVYYNNERRFPEALSHALASLQIKPDYALALANGAISYEGLGQYDEALALAQRQAQATPNDADALFNLGYFYSRVGRIDEAVAETKKALALSPNLVKAHNNLGYFLREEGGYLESAAEYQASLTIEPNSPGTAEALALSKKGLADKTSFEQARASSAQAFSQAGMAALQAGRVDEAVSQLEGAVALDPLNAQHHYNLGVALLQKSLIGAGAEQFRRAVLLRPDFSNAHFNLGFVLQSMGRLSEAEPHYREAARLNPKAPNAFLNLGILLSGEKRLAEADVFCSQAVKLDSTMASNTNCWRKNR